MTQRDSKTDDAFPTTTVGGLDKPGMSLRAYAAIALKVPDSGHEWLDEMIREARRDEIAAQVASGHLASLAPGSWGKDTPLAKDTAEGAYLVADAMLKERNAG